MEAADVSYKKQRPRNDSNDRDRSPDGRKSKKDKKHKHDRYSRSSSRGRGRDRRRDDRSAERSRDRKKKDRRYDDDRERDRDRDRGDRRRRSNSRDRRDRGDRNRGEKVEKDPYFDQRRQIERIRLTDSTKAQQMEEQLEKKIILESKQREYKMMAQKFHEAQKQMQEAKREDHTIIVYCLPLKAKEKHIWKFFYDSGCGKVRDIRIIRDNRSNRSKGVAYVEFYTSESVEKALLMAEKPFELRGRYFTSLKVQHSQAEKNRAAAAAKQMKLIKPVDPIEQAQETIKREMKVMVGGLTGRLEDIQQSELKELFEPFGPINLVDIHRDAQTGKCKGFAFIQYSNPEDAKSAVKEMNGLEISNQRISVATVSSNQRANATAGEDYLYSAGNKTALMNKLARDAPSSSNLKRPPISTISTQYIILSNMFRMEGTSPAFFEELKKEVLGKCAAFGIVEKSFIEKNNQGNVWIKFADTQSAIKAQENLNGMFYDSNKVFCYFVNEDVYQSRVGI